MQKWRDAFRVEDVHFVCVCVDDRAEATAREFQHLYFGANMFNALIEDRNDFPKFPSQLGCQGFVVLDASNSFLTPRSPAYNEYGASAFEYVEQVLSVARNAPSEHSAETSNSRVKARSNAVFVTNSCSESAQTLYDEDDEELQFRLPSVQHEKMDAEHVELEEAMRAVMQSCKVVDLHTLRKLFLEHCTNEENLMQSCGFGGEGKFSARTSHAEDHAAIGRMLTSTCEATNADGVIPQSRIRGICSRIIEHAVRFDAQYAGRLGKEDRE